MDNDIEVKSFDSLVDVAETKPTSDSEGSHPMVPRTIPYSSQREISSE